MTRVLAKISVAAFCLCALGSSVWAQSCPLCYEQTKQSGPRVTHAINLGILTLLLPTLVMFLGVLVFAFRRASSADRY